MRQVLAKRMRGGGARRLAPDRVLSTVPVMQRHLPDCKRASFARALADKWRRRLERMLPTLGFALLARSRVFGRSHQVLLQLALRRHLSLRPLFLAVHHAELDSLTRRPRLSRWRALLVPIPPAAARTNSATDHRILRQTSPLTKASPRVEPRTVLNVLLRVGSRDRDGLDRASLPAALQRRLVSRSLVLALGDSHRSSSAETSWVPRQRTRGVPGSAVALPTIPSTRGSIRPWQSPSLGPSRNSGVAHQTVGRRLRPAVMARAHLPASPSTVAISNAQAKSPKAHGAPWGLGHLGVSASRSIRKALRDRDVSRASRPASVGIPNWGGAETRGQSPLAAGIAVPRFAHGHALINIGIARVRIPRSRVTLEQEIRPYVTGNSRWTRRPVGISPNTLAQRRRRAERPLAQPQRGARPSTLIPDRHESRRISSLAMPLPARSSRSRPPADATLTDLESSIAAKLARGIDGKIAATIKQSLSVDAEYSRTMTERVYTALYDRMILERERIG